MRTAVVLHPAQRRSAAARRLLRSEVRDLTVLETRPTPSETAAALARRAVDAGAERVIAAGGDGTVRDVAGVLAGTGIPLGIVPIGTANLFALNLGLTGPPARTVRSAACGPARRVDVGRADWVRGDGFTGGSLFLVVAGIGRDAETVSATHPHLKRYLGHAGWLAYLESGARHIARPPVGLTVSVDGAAAERIRVWTLLAGNAGRIPAGIEIFPGTVLDDGILETLSVTAKNPLEWARAAERGLLHSRRPAPGLHYGSARRLDITADRPRPIQLDGDVVLDVARLALTVDRQALAVAAPARTAPGRGGPRSRRPGSPASAPAR